LEAGAVFAVIAANGAIGFITERQAEHSIANLGIGGPRSCHVLRAGASQEVDVESLVPGDVLELHGGMAIPADARLLSSEALTISEAALTGESVPVHKSASAVVAPNAALGDRRNMVYRGTIVTGGAGTAMVMATGGKTELGAIQRLVGSTATPQTPMQNASFAQTPAQKRRTARDLLRWDITCCRPICRRLRRRKRQSAVHLFARKI
jgi:Ca2+-transporting ATPase